MLLVYTYVLTKNRIEKHSIHVMIHLLRMYDVWVTYSPPTCDMIPPNPLSNSIGRPMNIPKQCL